MNIEEAKAFLIHYADTTPIPSRLKKVVRVTSSTSVTHIAQIDNTDLTKLKSIRKMADEGYELYTADEVEAIRKTPNLVALYNVIRPTDLWEAVSKTGTLRLNSLRYRRHIKEKGPN